jgi:UDP-N-acetylglucosamine 4,6-dehydratase
MVDRYVIEPAFMWWDRSTLEGPAAKRVADNFRYSSDTNPDWIDAKRLTAMLNETA